MPVSFEQWQTLARAREEQQPMSARLHAATSMRLN